MSRAYGPLADRPDRPVVGLEVSHESADLHVTGAALYTQDLTGRTLGTLHAWPVQAPHAHALVTDLRVAAAYEVPGVVRVLTARDVPGLNDAGEKHDEPLFPSEVMYYGHAVCWVLGETLEAARQGAAQVEADYEPLPALISVHDAIEAGSYQGNQRTVSRGNAAAALETAAYRFSGELEIGGQEHFYLETQAALALVDENGQIFVQSSTQHPSETQDIVAHVLDLAAHQVTVQCLRMGGGFGGKEFQPHGLAAIAALGATLTGHPVSLRLNRTQDITMTGKRHPFFATWEVGFDADKRLCALRATLTANGGWSLDLSEPVLARALCHIDNAYWIPDIEVTGRVAKTNRASNTAFRGFGGPQGMIVIEDILGRCAPVLGVSPEELRRRNFYVPGQATPYGQPVRHPERLSAIWSLCLERSDFGRRQAEVAAFNATHPDTKRGLAITPVKFGISFNLTAFNQAGALVHVYKDGSVLINHGGTEMGQGLHTKMIQVAATALGVPMRTVRLAPTRTDKVPNTSATAASSGADLNGGAIKDACDQIRSRLATVARGPARRAPGGRAVLRRGGHRAGFCGPAGHLARAGPRGVPPAGPALGGGLLPHGRAALGRRADAGRAVQVLRLRRRGGRDRGGRVHRHLPAAPGGHRARRRRQPVPADRRGPDRGRVRAGRRLADAGGAALGRDRRPAPGPAEHPDGEHLQDPELLGDARAVQRAPVRAGDRIGRGVRLEGGRRAAADGGVQRA